MGRRGPHARPGLADEAGQVLPLFAAVAVFLVAAGLILVQVGGAARLSTEGQTAADAAAIAGAQEVKREAGALAVSGGGGFGAAQVDQVAVCLAARDYAQRNDGRLTECHMEGFDVLTTVQSRTFRQDPDADLGVDRGDARATSRARARVTGIYANIPSGLGGGAGGGGGASGGGGSGSGVSDAELRSLEDKAGVKAIPGTALQRYGEDVEGLTEFMKIAILKAERLMHQPIVINSGYRSPAEQAAICASGTALGGRCAPPGQSYHNKGLAIDVGNSAALVPVAREVGLCQPFPSDDYVHFSPIGGSECGGSADPAGSGKGAFGGGGGLSSFVQFTVELVPYDAAPL